MNPSTSCTTVTGRLTQSKSQLATVLEMLNRSQYISGPGITVYICSPAKSGLAYFLSMWLLGQLSRSASQSGNSDARRVAVWTCKINVQWSGLKTGWVAELRGLWWSSAEGKLIMLYHRCRYWDRYQVVFLLMTWMMGQITPSAGLETVKIQRIVDQTVVLPFRGSLLVWGNGERGISWRPQREMVILHLGRDNPMHQYRLGTDGMESCFQEKIHESWPWSSSVSLEQRNLKASWAVSRLASAAGWGRRSCPSTQAQWDASGGTCPLLGYPVSERHGHTRVSPPQFRKDDWNICLTKRGWESWNSSAWRRGGWRDILSLCRNTWVRGGKEDLARVFSVAPRGRIRGSGCNLK